MNCYPEENTQPIILPDPSEEIWKKFEYFDKKANDYPNCVQYEGTRWELLDMWLEQFKKEMTRGKHKY